MVSQPFLGMKDQPCLSIAIHRDPRDISEKNPSETFPSKPRKTSANLGKASTSEESSKVSEKRRKDAGFSGLTRNVIGRRRCASENVGIRRKPSETSENLGRPLKTSGNLGRVSEKSQENLVQSNRGKPWKSIGEVSGKSRKSLGEMQRKPIGRSAVAVAVNRYASARAFEVGVRGWRSKSAFEVGFRGLAFEVSFRDVPRIAVNRYATSSANLER
eukprot:gene17300-biopygen10660